VPDAANSSPSVQRHLLVHGAKFDYERVTVQTPRGTLTREVVRHPGAVVILPVLRSGAEPPKVVLIRNWRISVEQELYELPAGTIEPAEEPRVCAARELEEETGYRAATLTPLGRFYTSPGLSDELMWAYFAEGLELVGQRLEPDEQLTVHPVGLDRALAMIDSGELADGKSILTLLLARARGLMTS
jgi:ADP-ribose pyrophosphatase